MTEQDERLPTSLAELMERAAAERTIDSVDVARRFIKELRAIMRQAAAKICEEPGQRCS